MVLVKALTCLPQVFDGQFFPIWVAAHQVRTVPQKINAIQYHWAGGLETSTWFHLVGFLGAGLLLAAIMIGLTRHMGRKGRLLKKAQEQARSMGIDGKRFGLLSVLCSGSSSRNELQLLNSLPLFDELTTRYLRRFCLGNVRPEPVIRALSSLRERLVESLGEPSKRQTGLLEIPLLTRIDVFNPMREGNKSLSAYIIGRSADWIRLVGLRKADLRTWEYGDPVRCRALFPDGSGLEFLARFEVVESAPSRMLRFAFSERKPVVPAGTHHEETLKQQVPILREGQVEETGLLEGISIDGARLSTATAFRAGERIYLELVSDDGESAATVEGCVLFCKIPYKGNYRVHISLDVADEMAFRIIEELDPRGPHSRFSTKVR